MLIRILCCSLKQLFTFNTSVIIPRSLPLRLLMGVVENASADAVSQLVNDSGVDLVLSNLLGSKKGGRLRFRRILQTVSISFF